MDENIEIDIAPIVPALPRIADKTKIDVRYMLIAPYVSAHIYLNKENSELVYEVEEPMLRSEEKKEVPSTHVGELVMRKLKKLDKVAYIRFASVYRQFADLESFEKELKKLIKK